MTDITERLRRLYVQHGTDYVQEAADEIESLRAELARKDEFYTRLAEVHEGAMKMWESQEREAEMKAYEMAAELKGLREEVERLRHDVERHIAMASELATENERLRAELEMAYAEIRKQVAGSKVVFDRDLVNRAKDAKPYNNHRIAWELERTAIGDGYYGNALRVAKDIPGLTPEDRSLLDRYATGINAGTDHVALQALAMRIDAAMAGGEHG